MILAVLAGHFVGSTVVRSLWGRGRLRARALVYGTDQLTRELAVEFSLRPDYGVDVVGFMANTRAVSSVVSEPVVDAGVGVVDALRRVGADRLVIGPGVVAHDRQAVVNARQAVAVGVPVFVVPQFFEMGAGAGVFAANRARGYPLVRIQRAAHPQVSLRLKRAFDIAVSVAVLGVAAPILLVIAGLVKLTSRGPVLYRQERVGQHGRSITIYKFRSMTESRNGDREWTADARVTKVGGWLRRLNLDELPQLLSVIRGDMSLVGPRPERPLFADKFGEVISDYGDRHRMPVGITGLAQVVGLRGDTSIAERVKYDNLYIDQWSLGADLQILAQTVVAVVRQGTAARHVIDLDRALSGVEAAGRVCPSDEQSQVAVLGRAAS